MNKEDKIKVLKNALTIYNEGESGGLCICIAFAVCDHLNKERLGMRIDNVIPEFNFNNILLLAKKHKFKKPIKKCFWWEYGEVNHRARAIGALVKQIKEQDDTREK